MDQEQHHEWLTVARASLEAGARAIACHGELTHGVHQVLVIQRFREE